MSALVLGGGALALGGGASALGSGTPALAQVSQARGHAVKVVSVASRRWGTVGGRIVHLYTLSNGHMRVAITNFGGVIQSIEVPDRAGKMADVALGFRKLAGYVRNDDARQSSRGSGTTYFGATIGRYANRIAAGAFTLDGVTYTLPVNNGPNTLHGGPHAWNSRVWKATPQVQPEAAMLTLTYTSPNQQDGFPGTVVATVTFTLTSADQLRIHYHATTDTPTVINMTNHSYFNLAGQASGTVHKQRLMINANRYTPTNDVQIPTGRIVSVARTPLDFRRMKPIGRDIGSKFPQLVLAHGYDHNFALNGHGLRLAARALDPSSGRELTVFTTEPGVQLYTGNHLAGDLVGPTGTRYRQHAGFTLETQHYPNSPNQHNFPSTTLNSGHPLDSTTVFRFSVVKG